jgi:hypothetical protein
MAGEGEENVVEVRSVDKLVARVLGVPRRSVPSPAASTVLVAARE